MTEHVSNSREQTFSVHNVDCENEAAKIQRELRKHPGVHEVKVSPQSSKVRVSFDPKIASIESVAKALDDLGFPVKDDAASTESPTIWRNKKVLSALISGLLLAVGWVAGKLGAPTVLSLSLYFFSVVIGGFYFAREALEELIHERRVGIELLMTVAGVAAALMGQIAEAAMLAFLYSISEAVEGYTEEKTRSSIRALMKLAPKVVTIERSGSLQEIPVAELAVGDVFLVRPGQAIATDGTVTEGNSSVNQAPVTGESVPVEKKIGDQVFAGTINAEGMLKVTATKTAAENTVAKIIQLVEEAQERKGESQKFIERFGRRNSPIVLLLGLLVAIVPPMLFHQPWSDWLSRATVFIVAAAPCALVISIPITLVAAIGAGARSGVLVKGGVHLENLAIIKAVALDKTGTVTHGRPEVSEIVVFESSNTLTEHELISFASSLERYSEHPLARSIVQYAQSKSIALFDVSEWRSITGAGATGKIHGSSILIGSPVLFAPQLETNASAGQQIADWQANGNTVIIVGNDSAAWGAIALRDSIRAEAAAAIKSLHESGIAVAMLTGDNERAAKQIASEVGIDSVFAELKPEDKVNALNKMLANYRFVAMVGDGVNDAPALAAATVGIAMGAVGSDVALETADVALMSDDLSKLPIAFKLAQRTRAIIRQNLYLSSAVIACLVLAAIFGFLSLPGAVLAHELSELIVIASGLRILRN
ncbi:MAG: cation-translocating P-type ATPase [Candidatus Obscuribacterales bacterium]|nr:cation-translocating P-type ATPase [Candidatus Obscuribacterales bacterium]